MSRLPSTVAARAIKIGRFATCLSRTLRWMQSTRSAGSRARFCHSVMHLRTMFVIVEIVVFDTSVP